jgi:hypothetical protein
LQLSRHGALGTWHVAAAARSVKTQVPLRRRAAATNPQPLLEFFRRTTRTLGRESKAVAVAVVVVGAAAADSQSPSSPLLTCASEKIGEEGPQERWNSPDVSRDASTSG